jgi:GNAT superfamily N-acetyltransferase
MLTLRPVVDADVAWLHGWLPPVAASVGYGAVDVAGPGASLIERMRVEPSLRARIIVRDGDDAGLVVYRVDAPRRGSAIIEIIATPPKHARRGSGTSAAAAVEGEVRAAGVRVVYVPAPAVHGIAPYFWIRLGYRPLLRAEWPCERAGVAWLAREL